MRIPNIAQLRYPMKIICFMVGILLSVAACGVLVAHTKSFSLKRDTAVMIGTTLPELRSSVALLRANREAEEYFSRTARSAREEQASVYVLPNTPAASRTVTVLQTIVSALSESMKEQGAIQTVVFADRTTDHDSYKTLRGTLRMTGSFRFVATFLSILSMSGNMMIRDVFTDDATSTFLKQVNESAPLSLKAAEDFLYTDLLTYASTPDQVEQSMLSDLPSEVQPDVRAFVLSSGLAAVRTALSDVAPTLKKSRAWPLPLLTVDSLKRDGKSWEIGLTVYRR